MDSKIYLSLNGEQELSFLSWKQCADCGSVQYLYICILSYLSSSPSLISIWAVT